MTTALVTGGAGFFGSILKQRLLELGHKVVSIDLVPDNTTHPNLVCVRGDIRDRNQMAALFNRHQFETIYHCAAILAHVTGSQEGLWSSNVYGTWIVADCARRTGVPALVFLSSNCLWAENFHRPVREDDAPAPVEIYGRSKWEGEKILEGFKNDMTISIIRCPTIMDEGRLGLLSILFDFIREGRKVWVVGGGENKYQFIYAKDLVDACLRCATHNGFDVFNIGSDEVKSFREVYEAVIEKAGTKARVACLPKAPTILAMKVAHTLGLSPLGPYQYKMIAEDFVFDTDKIKTVLGWRPTLKNEEMLSLAYDYYASNFSEIRQRTNVSAHRQAAKMGIIRLLKWMS